MDISLSNPKTFLPLLLFIGLFFVIVGFSAPIYTVAGGMIIILAIGLWVLKNLMT